MLTRIPLKIQNTFERTVFAHDSERIDAVMHAEVLRSKCSQLFAIERVNSMYTSILFLVITYFFVISRQDVLTLLVGAAGGRVY